MKIYILLSLVVAALFVKINLSSAFSAKTNMSPFCLNVKVQIRPDQVRNVEFPQTPKVRQQSGCSTKDTLLVSVAVFLLTTPLIHTTLRLHDTEREVSGVHQSRPERLHPDRTCLPPVCGWRRYNESQRLLLSRRVRK